MAVALLLAGCTTHDDPQAAPAPGLVVAEDTRVVTPLVEDPVFVLENYSMPSIDTLRLDFRTAKPVQVWVQDASGMRVGEVFVRASTERRVEIDLKMEGAATQRAFTLDLYAAASGGGDITFHEKVEFAGPRVAPVPDAIRAGIDGDELVNVTYYLHNSGDAPAILRRGAAEHFGHVFEEEWPSAAIPPGETRYVLFEPCAYCDGITLVKGSHPLNVSVTLATGAVVNSTVDIVREGANLTLVGALMTRQYLSYSKKWELDNLRVNVTNTGDLTTRIVRWQVTGHSEAWPSYSVITVAPGRTASILVEASWKGVEVGPTDTPWRVDFSDGSFLAGVAS